MIAEAGSFVLFPLGEKKFALPAEIVTELARPGRLQSFPHRTPLMLGVLARRGRIVPVLDIARILVGPDAPSGRFYLIANRQFASSRESTAIPVTGECALASCVPESPGAEMPEYVSGVLSVGGETIEVVDLERLIAPEDPS